MPILTKSGTCKHCNIETTWELSRNIANNGASQVFWMCSTCKQIASGQFIPHEKIESYGIQIGSIPVINDYRTEFCVVCAEAGTEYHHFAPKHLFHEEADNWPTAYLCKKHHQEWHDKVTPEMSKRRGK